MEHARSRVNPLVGLWVPYVGRWHHHHPHITLMVNLQLALLLVGHLIPLQVVVLAQDDVLLTAEHQQLAINR